MTLPDLAARVDAILPDLAARVDAILELPWELIEYERWIAADSAKSDDYLFSETRARFEARLSDVLRRPDDLELASEKSGLVLRSQRLGGGIPITGFSRTVAERLLALIDGRKSLAELYSSAGPERTQLEKLVRTALGSVLFVPEAISGLESRISGAELVRFVGTPYEIVRSYWENMADVRVAAERTLTRIGDLNDFVRWLRQLHVIALLGAELDRFYRPASRITAQGVRPGRLYQAHSESVETARGTLLLSGPRVGVNLLGGEHYSALLYDRDPEALLPLRTIRDADGTDWGSFVTARALDETKDAAWYRPPRPLTEQHFTKLYSVFRAAIDAAEGSAGEEAEQALARFHYRFVRLHPFRCANQSLSMNLTNAVLSRIHGFGIPHLLLDQLALRCSEEHYLRLFSRAIRAHAVAGSSTERWFALRKRRDRAYGLIERLRSASSLEAARQLASSDPDSSLSALLEIEL